MSTITIPPVTMIRRRLLGLTQKQLHQLAEDSSVPFATLMKIRHATTKNPGITTVSGFWHLLPPEPQADAK